ncbi:hypothetical protein SY83_02710 [Paenibacillus swuensis]|uniref:Glycosyl transferase family 1 n=2 Tax=Paenibacillus swuensis TaxID=1178515 RepID=A0A172TET3_9BACL|nr:hypothetical protein SY83_02710 [Paenibacillus swuensis]
MEKLNVLFLTKYGEQAASSRYRTFQYLDDLKKNGIEATISPLMSNGYIHRLYAGQSVTLERMRGYFKRITMLLRSRSYDLIWIEKEALPWIPHPIEQMLLNGRTPYILDYDDAIFHNYDHHPKKWVRTLLSRKIPQLMKKAALVVAGNPYLAAFAEQSGGRSHILPTVINLDKYPVERKSSSETLTIGWIGSPSTTKYLYPYVDLLDKLCDRYGSKVRLVGAKPAIPLPDCFEVIPWSEETEISELIHMDIGIMPLENNPWEQGKCGFKLIQYMGCFLPVVASPVGVNKDIVSHGENGFLASSPDEWEHALRQLLQSGPMRHTMGILGRARVEQSYALTQTSASLLELIRNVAKEDCRASQ